MSTIDCFRSVLLCAIIISSCLFSKEAAAQDGAVDSPDHPLVVAAAASVDRLLDQAVQLMRINGVASTRDEVLAFIKQIPPVTEEEVPPAWLDPSKPLGLMFFYDSTFLGFDTPSAAARPPEAGEETKVSPSGILGAIPDFNVAPNRVIVFFPVKSYQRMLTWGNLAPVAGKANCFHDDKGVEQYLRRFGPYVVMGLDGDLVEHCPDPRELAKSVLGKNDLAVSLQLKGMPPLLRSFGAEGIKSVYEAGLQRRDDEQERDYRLRRALGDIARELLELAMTQIDEATLGIRMDAELRFTFDLEVNGTNEGKLAKFAAEMTPKKSAFDPLWNADYDQSLGMSLSLPTRHTKPLAAAIRNHVATATDDAKAIQENAVLFDSGCRILDSNQFELVWTGERDGDANVSLFGLKLPTNREFPRRFEEWMQKATESDEGVTTTSLEGWPVYQLKSIPFFSDLPAIISAGVLGTDAAKDDTKCHSWVLATPDALWLCSRKGLSEGPIPSLLHRAADVKTLTAEGTRNRRSVAPLRMSLHPRLWKISSTEPDESDPAVDRKPNPEREQNFVQQAARQELYDAHPDGITVELLPTSRGFKLGVAFDTAYVVVVPQLIKSIVW